LGTASTKYEEADYTQLDAAGALAQAPEGREASLQADFDKKEGQF
jgi:hypothetical protein